MGGLTDSQVVKHKVQKTISEPCARLSQWLSRLRLLALGDQTMDNLRLVACGLNLQVKTADLGIT